MSQLSVKYVSIDELIPYSNNSRTHSDEQVAQVAASIREFGFTNPILVDESQGIIAGHGRLLAAKKLNLDQVPTITLEGLTEAQRKAYVIADNKLALNAGWDEQALQAELERLKELDFDLALTGFDPDELSKLLEPEQIEGLTDEDEVPEVPDDPVSKEGDIWVCGNHRVMCGDSTSVDALSKLITVGQTDLHTDPPYGISADKMTLGTGKKEFHRGAWDSEIPDFFQVLHLFDKQILWGANYYADKLKPSNDWLCWHKKNDGLSFSEFELAWSNLGKNCRIVQHHWSGEKKVHPTQKPLPVVEWCIKMLGSSVTDLFGGSGSTLIACENAGKQSFTMELDPRYIDVIVKRWQDFTGKDAVLESTGQTFNEVTNG